MSNTRLNSGILATILVLCAGSNGCWFRKSPTVFTPPPPQAQPNVSADAPKLPEPPKIAADPEATNPPVTPNSMPEAPAPPKPVPQPKKTITTAPPKPVAPAPAEPQPEPPKLTQVFTAEERREYNRMLDESLDRVKKALAALAKKGLNPEQAEIVTRITTFQKQAEQSREAQDLTIAVSLAKTAAVLAEDLLGRLP